MVLKWRAAAYMLGSDTFVMTYFTPDCDRSILTYTYQYVFVLYGYHFVVRQQIASLSSHISELLQFSSWSVCIVKYASVLACMGPYMF